MITNTAILALTALFQVANSAPSDDNKAVKPNPNLRLVKTAEEDVGRWVTEAQKFELFTSKRIGFYDITDIQDKEVLSVLSTPPTEDSSVTRLAVTYPTTLDHIDEANALLSGASNDGPESWMQSLTDFNTRHYQSTTGTQAASWLYDEIVSIASANAAITVKKVTHSYNQPSVIAQIPGESPDLIVVGAHFDSTGGSRTARSPGADDNASGTVCILEALRVLAEAGFKPQNTLEFHWYSGEEGGLLGSQDVWAQYKSAGKTVLGFVNQDMTGYSPSGKVSIYTDYVDTALTKYVRLVATEYTGTTTSDVCGYACSDHGSARSNGFPTAYVCDEVISTSSPYIHSPDDSLDTIMWPAILRHTKFTIAFLVEGSYI